MISNSPSLQHQKHLHLAVEVYVEVYEISLANCLDLVCKSGFLGLCQMVRQNGYYGLLWPHFQIVTPAGLFACSIVASIGTVAAVETFIAKLFSP